MSPPNSNQNLASLGKPISTKELMAIIEQSEKDLSEGNVFTMDEVKEMVKNWKNRKKNNV